MKTTFTIALLFLSFFIGSAQNNTAMQKTERKGNLYVYWGWNRGWYSNSDINFTGTDYDFTLHDVVAKDRQSPINADTYLNPANMTIPQYNFRIGYFINDNYDLSFGIDHMKYVVESPQDVTISGNISNTGTEYDGTYNNDDITIEDGLLALEHTDGLNYVNIELHRFDEIYAIKHISINLTEGLGVGVMIPKTNATLLNFENHDEFHLAGFGINGMVALNFTFFKYFFIQPELKAGYINMSDILTTSSDADRAKQSIFFTQFTTVIGAQININKKSK
jgi:hypothetical protein